MRSVGPGTRRVVVLLGLGVIALASGGCLAAVLGTAAAGGAVGYAYYRGSSSRDLPGHFDAAFAAAQYALADEGLAVAHKQAYFDTGEVMSQTPKGDQITISVEPASEDDTVMRVHVRVGYFGDRELSERLLDRIAARMQQIVVNPAQPSLVTNPAFAGQQVTPAGAQTVPPSGPQQTAPPPIAAPAETAPPPFAGPGSKS